MLPLAARLVPLLCLLAGGPALAKPSCGSGGAVGQTTTTAGGGELRLSVPSSYISAQPMPLLLALHGDEGTPDYIYSAFLSLQKSSNGAFILAAPKAPFGGGSWYQATAQHVTFVNAVLSALLAAYNIDQDRIWITGWSGGATFLGYYAPLRQDVLAAVVYHMGGGGGGPYSPPAGSCLIPARFVIGSEDFLYSLAKQHYNLLQSKGHEAIWVELPGVAHTFQPQTLPETWSWLQARTLCGKTTAGTCGAPSPAADAGKPGADAGAAVTGDGVNSTLSPDAGLPPAPDAAAPTTGEEEAQGDPGTGLRGGCSLAAADSRPAAHLPYPLLVLLPLLLSARSRRSFPGAAPRASWAPVAARDASAGAPVHPTCSCGGRGGRV